MSKNFEMVNLNDRAFNYGDGCFTTINVRNDSVCLLNEHMQRLEYTCSKLVITNIDWQTVRGHIVARASELHNGVLKVVISRGVGGRGYSPEGAITPQFYISTHDMPTSYEEFRHTGISLGLSEVRLGHQPMLAGLKHLNRLEQVLIKQAMQSCDVDDVVVCDLNDKIVETSSANIFWQIGSSWYTPDLSLSGVHGIVRNKILEFFAENDIACSIVQQSPDTLLSADCIIMCNCLLGIAPVKRFVDNNGNVKQYDTRLTEWIQKGISLST